MLVTVLGGFASAGRLRERAPSPTLLRVRSGTVPTVSPAARPLTVIGEAEWFWEGRM